MKPEQPFAVGPDGWLAGVRRLPSPHRDARPEGEEVSLLVIHGISLPPGEFGTGQVEALFTGRLDPAGHPAFAALAELRVSAHLFVDRQGAVTQFVSCAERAWHAGASCFARRPRCNDFSIGIELEGTDLVPYSDEQYRILVALTRALFAAYPALGLERIVGHRDIAPRRKSDPGLAFDWHRYLVALEGVR
ncbi:MAG: N-acetyl-anhydromuranmyl-L-alanine amidase [Porticoccaceae bacterium]|nr:MAG: N-acetyl-anhydromuranmyl-L-alanine amidase [Porticoccaceae bacterium]